ncbi:hypothetical protein JTB14_017459 [Gonioctena quinquepunctata]|nr:hypothetical protein JTB14_017459 [Gonioctena quinquepunctata]
MLAPGQTTGGFERLTLAQPTPLVQSLAVQLVLRVHSKLDCRVERESLRSDVCDDDFSRFFGSVIRAHFTTS